MKTPIDRLVEHIRSEYPDLVIIPHLILNLKQMEKQEKQVPYKVDYANAKKIYDDKSN
jgi:hypothetical protein